MVQSPNLLPVAIIIHTDLTWPHCFKYYLDTDSSQFHLQPWNYPWVPDVYINDYYLHLMI